MQLPVKFGWVHAVVSEKPELRDGRLEDRCPRDDSSSAVQALAVERSGRKSRPRSMHISTSDLQRCSGSYSMHFSFQLCLTLSAELLSWRRRPSSVRPLTQVFSETAPWIAAKFCGKPPIRRISRRFIFTIFFFVFFVNMGPYMGAKMSKRYTSSFHRIRAKLYDK